MSAGFMNSIVAFIQPFQIERVVDALRSIPDFPGMSVSEVRGFGRLQAHQPRRGERTEVEPFERRVRIEIHCVGSAVSAIAETIHRAAHTGNSGDGVIFISDLAWAYRIRSEEQGQDALGP